MMTTEVKGAGNFMQRAVQIVDTLGTIHILRKQF